MVGVTGSIPVVPTINGLRALASLGAVSSFENPKFQLVTPWSQLEEQWRQFGSGWHKCPAKLGFGTIAS
jgi:hypothetical protein